MPVRPKGKGVGRFEFSKRLIKPGRYSIGAELKKSKTDGGSKDPSRRFHISYPDLGKGDSGDVVKTFNKLLGGMGYVNDEGKAYDSATGRAVLAYHKVNGNARKENSSSGMFKKLAKGKGGFKLKDPASAASTSRSTSPAR